MAIEDYWASTARNAKDIAQYAIYPLTKVTALMVFKDSYKANLAAGLTTTAFYTGLTGLFLGREMDGFDKIARLAVAAEMGKKPEELVFSDYLDSQNCVIKKRMDLFKQENKQRYPVSLMPMLPTVMEHVTRTVSPGMKPDASILEKGETRWLHGRPKANASAMSHALNGWNLWDAGVYAGVATLWLLETFSTDKTFAYQGRKEMENNESLGLKVDANNIAGLFNRARVDCDLPMVDDKIDREKLWPIYEILAEKVNKNPHFGLPEMAYLMGLGKIDIFAKDSLGRETRDRENHLTVDPQAYQRALDAIEHVDKVGLLGIAEETRKQHEAMHIPDKTGGKDASFVDRLGRNWLDAHFNAYQRRIGTSKKFSESISPRDPGEVPLSIA